MTATNRLRALLDERGVKWKDSGEGLTIIPAQDGVLQAWTVNTWPSGKNMGDCLWVQNRIPLTPEQAVEATLGRGECKNVASVEYDYLPGDFQCSECGCIVASDEHSEPLVYFTPWDFGDEIGWRYCPSCGRKVVK